MMDTLRAGTKRPTARSLHLHERCLQKASFAPQLSVPNLPCIRTWHQQQGV